MAYGISREDMERYVNAGMSDMDIAEATFYTPDTVKVIRCSYGLKRHMGPQPKLSRERFAAMIREEMSYKEISRVTGLSESYLAVLRSRYKLPKMQGDARHVTKAVIQRCVTDGMTQQQAADSLGISVAWYRELQKKHGIKQPLDMQKAHQKKWRAWQVMYGRAGNVQRTKQAAG